MGSRRTIRFSRMTVLYVVSYSIDDSFRASNEATRPTLCCVGSQGCLTQNTFSVFSQDVAVPGGTSDRLGFGMRSMGRNLSKKPAFKTPDKEFSNLNSQADEWVAV